MKYIASVAVMSVILVCGLCGCLSSKEKQIAYHREKIRKLSKSSDLFGTIQHYEKLVALGELEMKVFEFKNLVVNTDNAEDIIPNLPPSPKNIAMFFSTEVPAGEEYKIFVYAPPGRMSLVESWFEGIDKANKSGLESRQSPTSSP
jgi:hypothetical protein